MQHLLLLGNRGPHLENLGDHGKRFQSAILNLELLHQEAPETQTSIEPHAHSSSSTLAGERKLVTILCGALANAVTLAEQQGFEALRRARAAFFSLAQQEVLRYAGSLQPFGDDGFLALFGVPVTQEDHAFRAVLAALGMQQRLHEHGPDSDATHTEELAVRLGLHTGLVMMNPSGAGSQSPATVIGETTDLAIRLQYLATPDTLLASEATMHLVQGAVHRAVWGQIRVTGEVAPVMVYTIRAIDPQRVPLVWQRLRPLSAPFHKCL